jgi:hypothetical protein
MLQAGDIRGAEKLYGTAPIRVGEFRHGQVGVN